MKKKKLMNDYWHALTVERMTAEGMTTKAYDDDGTEYGDISIIRRDKDTTYRGKVLICSADEHIGSDVYSGETLGIVELYDVKPAKELTGVENYELPEEQRYITEGYAWCFRNPRRVIEMPVMSKKGFHRLATSKDEIIEYPRVMVLDDKAYREIRKRY